MTNTLHDVNQELVQASSSVLWVNSLRAQAPKLFIPSLATNNWIAGSRMSNFSLNEISTSQ